MRPFTDFDFPLVAQGHNVYRKSESSPICTCAEQEMAVEIAMRLNRDNQRWSGSDPAYDYVGLFCNSQ